MKKRLFPIGFIRHRAIPFIPRLGHDRVIVTFSSLRHGRGVEWKEEEGGGTRTTSSK